MKYLFRAKLKDTGSEIEEVVDVLEEEIYKHKTDKEKNDYLNGLFEKWLFNKLEANFTRIRTNQCCYCGEPLSDIMLHFCYYCQRYQPVQKIYEKNIQILQ